VELDVLAFGERLIAAIPALRAEAGRIAPGHDDADKLVRDTVAKAWRKRAAGRDTDLPAWLGAIMRHEHATRSAEPRSFGAGV
jgi:RNA polymerase sigma-70 factor (ECF subfamily)